MKEKKHWNRRVLSFFLALAMVITQLGVWNAGKESVQAADTVIYQEDFSKSTDGWTPEWSVGSDLTTFAVGKNYAKDNDSSLNIWSKKAQVLTITHEVSAVEEGNYYVSLNTYGGSVNSGTISISDGTTEQSADIGFSDGLTEYKTKNALTVNTGASITIKVTVDLNEGGWGYLDDITLTRADNSNTDAYMTKTFYFKYTGDGIPAIQFWKNCDGNLLAGKDESIAEIDGSSYYCMEKIAGKNGWYQIELKYKKDGINNKEVGFDLDELSSEITKGLEIIPVSQMEEVLKIALMRTRRKKDGN